MRRKRNRVRWVVYSTLGLLSVAWAVVAYVTRPAALHARLASVFRTFGLEIVSIGDVSFSVFNGLYVQELVVDPPAEHSQGAARSAALLRVPLARVSFDHWKLLGGTLAPSVVVLDRPQITLTRPSAGERFGWRIPDREHRDRGGWSVGDLPEIRIESGDLQLLSGSDGALMRRWIVDGAGQLVVGDRPGDAEYKVLIRQTAGRAMAAGGAATAEVVWRPGEARVSLGAIDLQTLSELLPADAAALAAEYGVAGRLWLNEFVQNSAGQQRAEIGFADASLTIPVERWGAEITAKENAHGDGVPVEVGAAYARLSNAAGRIRVNATGGNLLDAARGLRGNVECELDGQFAGGGVRVRTEVRDLWSRDASSPMPATDSGRVKIGGANGLCAASYFLLVEVRDAHLPDGASRGAFQDSPGLLPRLRAFFDDYQPTGAFAFELQSAQGLVAESGPMPAWYTNADAASPRAGFRGAFRPLGGSCRYHRFPYLMSGVYGAVCFSDAGVDLVNLAGRHGPGVVRANGHVNDSSDITGFDLTFDAQNIALNLDLYEAIPPEHQRLWRAADPTGLADVVVRVSRDAPVEGVASETRIAIDTQLLSAALSLSPQRRLTQADGRIHIENGVLTIHDLHGFCGAGSVRVRGSAAPPPADDLPPMQDLRIEAASMPLERSGRLTDAAGKYIGEVSFRGVGDVWGSIRSTETGVSEAYTIRINDGELCGFDASDPWRELRGMIHVDGDEQRIERLAARRGDEWIDLSGLLRADKSAPHPTEMELSAGDPAIERLLRRLVPQRWVSVRDGLGLSGAGTLHAVFRAEPSDDGSAQQAVDVRISAARMKPGVLPLDLADVKAYLTLRPDGLTLHKADASYGAGSAVALTGAAGWTEQDEWAELRGTATALPIGPALTSAMPEALASILRRVTLDGGRLNATFAPLKMSSRTRGTWEMSGGLVFDAASMRVGVPLSNFSGRLNGSCRVLDNSQLEIAADFEIDRGLLRGKAIREWKGRLLQSPGQRVLRLEDVHGYLCDGQIVGEAQVNVDSGEYELSMTLDDIELDSFLRDDPSPSGAKRPGRLNGRVFVRGRGDDPAARSGGGELRIVGASLLSSPVTAGVLEASRQKRKPISEEIDRADIRFVWEGDEMKFNRVDIQSRDQRLVGRGVWNVKRDTISLELLGASPEDAPRLAVISELLERASNELMQYRVEGPVSKPKVTLEPLHNLTEPLRRLLRGE